MIVSYAQHSGGVLYVGGVKLTNEILLKNLKDLLELEKVKDAYVCVCGVCVLCVRYDVFLSSVKVQYNVSSCVRALTSANYNIPWLMLMFSKSAWLLVPTMILDMRHPRPILFHRICIHLTTQAKLFFWNTSS